MKSLIFTDIHFGINSDKPSRQKIAEAVVDEIANVCVLNGIEKIFFLGDFFHHRTSIEVSTLNLADKAIRKLASSAELVLIQGNHDLYEKSGLSMSSTGIFSRKNVRIVATPEETELNGQSVLLVPWCGDGAGQTISGFMDVCGFKPTKKYDIAMGHFSFSDAVEIERAFVSLKSKMASENGLNAAMGGTTSKLKLSDCQTQMEELFALTHPGSALFLGHVHEHKETVIGKRIFHIVGSPQHQVHDLKGLDPSRKLHGYFILDDENHATFHETKAAPRFVTVYASEIKNPTADTRRKLSALSGCIVKRCYDCSLTDKEKKAFDETMGEAGILEEDSAAFLSEGNKDEASKEIQSVQESEMFTISRKDYLERMSKEIIEKGMKSGEYSFLDADSEIAKVQDMLFGYLEAVS